MGVRLYFHVDEMPLVEEGVANERTLLKRAQDGNENAAVELLLMYEKGKVRDPVVRNWIVLGHSLVATQLATAALRKKKKALSSLSSWSRMRSGRIRSADSSRALGPTRA